MICTQETIFPGKVQASFLTNSFNFPANISRSLDYSHKFASERGFGLNRIHMISRILPFVLLISMALWQSQQLQTAREAVFLHSHHFWQQLRVEWPHYLLVFLVGMVFSLRELEISLLTVPPGGETLPIRVFNLLHYGAGADVARLSLLLAFPIAIAAFGIMRKLEHTR